MTPLSVLRRECAHKRREYQIARQVFVEVTRLAVPDRTAVQRELEQALLDRYRAHGAFHAALRARGIQTSLLN